MISFRSIRLDSKVRAAVYRNERGPESILLICGFIKCVIRSIPKEKRVLHGDRVRLEARVERSVDFVEVVLFLAVDLSVSWIRRLMKSGSGRAET